MNSSHTPREKKPRKLQKKQKDGFVFSLLYALYAFLCKKARTSTFARVMFSYDKTQSKADNGAIAAFIGKISNPEKTLRIRRKIAGVLCKNPLARHTRSVLNSLICCRCRDIGTFILTFGIYALLMCSIKPYFSKAVTFNAYQAVISGACILFAIPLLREKMSLGSYIYKNKFLKFVIFSIIGARNYEIYQTEAKRAPSGIALILGMACGLLVFITSPQTIIFCIIGIFLTIGVLRRPETGVVLLFLIFPFVSVKTLAFTAFTTLISFMFKVLQLKRTFKFSYSDFWILLFAILLLLGGIVSPGGINAVYTGIKMALFTLCLFLAKNLMPTFEWIKRCFMTCVLSVTSACLYSYFRLCISENVFQTVIDSATSGVSSVFPLAEQFAVYLSAMIPFVLFCAMINKTDREKNTSYVIILMCAVCLIFTLSLGGYIAAFITVYMLLLTYSKKTFATAVIAAVPTVAVFAIISQFSKTMILNVFTNDFASSQANLSALKDIAAYPIGGTGAVGTDTVYLSSYLSLARMFGIPCLILFISILFRYFRICLSGLYGMHSNVLRTQTAYYIIAPMFSVLAMALHAFYCCEAINGNALLLMFLVMGLGEATVNYAKEEAVLISEMKWAV